MYKVSDIIHAADKGKVYPAKIMKIEATSGKPHYFIHFQGWDRKYDIWIEEDCMAPFKDEAKLEALKADCFERHMQGTKASASKRPSEPSAPPSSSASTDDTISSTSTKPAKRARKENTDAALDEVLNEVSKQRRAMLASDLVDEDDAAFSSRLEMGLELKKHLVDEWTVVTKEGRRLLPLPRERSRTVAALLDDFLEHKRKALRTQPDQITFYEELFAGLRTQFDRALPSLLLYRQEREQYTQLLAKHPEQMQHPVNVFGTEHLLRFYVRLPKLLATICLPEKEVTLFVSKIAELLHYLGKNARRYLDMAHYVPAAEAMSYLASWTDDLPSSAASTSEEAATTQTSNESDSDADTVPEDEGEEVVSKRATRGRSTAGKQRRGTSSSRSTKRA